MLKMQVGVYYITTRGGIYDMLTGIQISSLVIIINKGRDLLDESECELAII